MTSWLTALVFHRARARARAPPYPYVFRFRKLRRGYWLSPMELLVTGCLHERRIAGVLERIWWRRRQTKGSFDYEGFTHPGLTDWWGLIFYLRCWTTITGSSSRSDLAGCAILAADPFAKGGIIHDY